MVTGLIKQFGEFGEFAPFEAMGKLAKLWDMLREYLPLPVGLIKALAEYRALKERLEAKLPTGAAAASAVAPAIDTGATATTDNTGGGGDASGNLLAAVGGPLAGGGLNPFGKGGTGGGGGGELQPIQRPAAAACAIRHQVRLTRVRLRIA